MKHLEENNTCPECDLVIHQSHPLQYISFDRTMQDIVYKLVPNLQQSKRIQRDKIKMRKGILYKFLFLDELRRERDFYRLRGLACPKDLPSNLSEAETAAVSGENKPADADHHRFDEQVSPIFGSFTKFLGKVFIINNSEAGYYEVNFCRLTYP